MNPSVPGLVPTTRPLRAETVRVLEKLQPGDRLRIIQTVRVGLKSWTTTVTGTFRSLNALVTGLATERVPEDDIIVPTVHFIKENGELSSVSLDENSVIEPLTA
jgi:hypothetical protein